MILDGVRRSPSSRNLSDRMIFTRKEFGEILPVYGRMVAAGQWRDYDISCHRNSAVFSIFRRAWETPIYRIEKRVDPRSRKNLYLVIGLDGRIIRRGHELRSVLGVFDQKLLRIVISPPPVA